MTRPMIWLALAGLALLEAGVVIYAVKKFRSMNAPQRRGAVIGMVFSVVAATLGFLYVHAYHTDIRLVMKVLLTVGLALMLIGNTLLRKYNQ